jgi:heme/copper-type cytochrome/quinol oxidase subunit 1
VATDLTQSYPRWSDGPIVRRLLSTDHKHVGLGFIILAGLFLVALGILRLLWFLDFAHVPGGLLDGFGERQVFSLQATVALFLVALPLGLGLTTHIVPLQVGARSTRWPQLGAFSLWLYVAGGLLMIGSFATGTAAADSPLAPFSEPGLQLFALGLLIVCIAGVGASCSLLLTVRGGRGRGMTSRHFSSFTWAGVAFAAVLLLSLTILAIVALVFLIDDGAARGFFVYDTNDTAAFAQTAAWFAGNPLTFAVLIPVLGAMTEIVPVLGRRVEGIRRPALAAIAGLAALAALLAIYHLLADPFGDTFAEGVPYAGFVAIGALGLSALAVLPGLRPRQMPPPAAVVLVAGAVALLVIGTILGFALGFPGGYDADGAHLVAHFDGTLTGIALLGFSAALLYWLPKLTGRTLDERRALGAAVLLSGGAIIQMIGQHIAAQGDVGAWSTGAKIGASVALAGYLLVFLGGTGLFVGVLTARMVGRRVGNDPWQGDTLEWYATSPPAPHNFDRLPEIRSRRPLADLRRQLDERYG